MDNDELVSLLLRKYTVDNYMSSIEYEDTPKKKRKFLGLSYFITEYIGKNKYQVGITSKLGYNKKIYNKFEYFLSPIDDIDDLEHTPWDNLDAAKEAANKHINSKYWNKVLSIINDLDNESDVLLSSLEIDR